MWEPSRGIFLWYYIFRATFHTLLPDFVLFLETRGGDIIGISLEKHLQWAASEGGEKGLSFVVPGCIQKVFKTTTSRNDSSN